MNKNVLDTDLTGKVAVVTGAGGVLCSAFAKTLARAGAKVALLDLNEEAAQQFADEIVAEGGVAKAYKCNVLEKETCYAVADQVAADLGTCDILVNGAGGNNPRATTDKEYFEMGDIDADTKSFFDLDASGVSFVFNLNFLGTLIPTQAFARQMIGKEGCNIINISSMMSELGRETVSAYAAAKGGLKMLTRNIASEYGEYNIQCNGIGPGYIATPQTAPLREIQPDGSRHPFDQFIISKTPAARWGEAEELQGPAVFLASDASNFVNGHILYVDGGILAYIGKQPQ